MTSKDKIDLEFEKDTLDHTGDIEQIKDPEDKNHFVYMLFVLFGIGALLPWNAILTSMDFFKVKVCISFVKYSLSLMDTDLISSLVSQSTACWLLLLFVTSSTVIVYPT